MSVTRAASLRLYRDLLRQSSKITNYNFSEHAKRRSRYGFDLYKAATPEVAQEQFEFGLKQLDIVRRQGIISGLFPNDVSVMTNLATGAK